MTTDADQIADALAAPFDPREVKFKPTMVKNNRCLAMAYVSARTVMDRLDDVVGVANWQDEYTPLPSGSVLCRLSIRVGGEWVVKMDVGSPSEQPDEGDREKAAVSDALKRAAVKWGVSRYLYRLAAQWVDYDPVKRQIITPPQLPAFAVPKGAAAPKKAPPQPAPAGNGVPANPATDPRAFQALALQKGKAREWTAMMGRLNARFGRDYTAQTKFSEVEPGDVQYLVDELKNMPDAEPAKA